MKSKASESKTDKKSKKKEAKSYNNDDAINKEKKVDANNENKMKFK